MMHTNSVSAKLKFEFPERNGNPMVHTQFVLAEPKFQTCRLRNRTQCNDSRKLRRRVLCSLLRSTGPSAISESSLRTHAVARPFVTPSDMLW